MRSGSFCVRSVGLCLLTAAGAFGQVPGTPTLTVGAPSQKVVLKRGGPATVAVPVKLASGYHVNSDKPVDEYLIPLRLTWDAGLLDSPTVAYPTPKMEKYEFSEKPLSVLTGEFTLETRAQVARTAMPGPGLLTGKLRYQACSEKVCYPPKTVPVRLTVEVR